jgi:hypothetical protein
MKTFNQYIKSRDIELYQQIVNEDLWQTIKKPLPQLAMALGGLGSTFAGNAILKHADQTQLPSPSRSTNADQTQLPSPSRSTKNDKQYSKDEILIKKIIYPKELIKDAQQNKSKWQKDFDNLDTDETGDIGHATIKNKFDKPILMYVVNDDAIKRYNKNAYAYANSSEDYIVMPKSAFEILPTQNSNGKLTKYGAETIAHELRHTTQNTDKTPKERNQGNGEWSIDKYMKDPAEMGVRIAALKNHMDSIHIYDILKKNGLPQEELKKAVTLLTALMNLKNENEMMYLILNPEKFTDPKYQKILNFYKSVTKQDNDRTAKSDIYSLLIDINLALKKQNSDVKSIINFYDSLTSSEEKQKFMSELMNNYGRIVKSNSNPNQPIA